MERRGVRASNAWPWGAAARSRGRWAPGAAGGRRPGAVMALLVVAALVLSACGGGGSRSGTGVSHPGSTVAGAERQGGTAVFALPPATIPNYIFPLTTLAHFLVVDTEDFQYLMYRPLYWFGQGGKPLLNEELSLARPPVWSHGGRTATITLKPYRWSDGEAVSASDVRFWQNMVTAEKANWAAYVPGNYPDNVVSTTVTGPRTIQFHLNGSYNHRWFLYNELSQITPMPAAWDVTSAGAAPGSGGCAASMAKCKAVYNFLINQAKDARSYATNRLWKVVDGPWTLQQYQTTGYAVFVPNRRYSGPVKPHLARFVEEPFTSDAAEYDAVRAGKVDYGYIPVQDAGQQRATAAQGYRFAPWVGWLIGYMYINQHNPTVGPMLRQAYIRQAMEELENQRGWVRTFYRGYGTPTCGPVPLKPSNPYVDSYERSCPHGYNPKKAVATLRAHGWHVVPRGVTTCARPGTGAGRCGPGVPAGAKLVFNLVYVSGNQPVSQSMQDLKSTMRGAGIVLHLSSEPFNTMAGSVVACKPQQPTCSWEIYDFGFGWTYAPDYYPTGGEIFGTGAGSNASSYSSATNDANIAATHHSSSPAVFRRYEDYLTDQVPVLWTPSADYQLSVIRSNLHGTLPQNPLAAITPESWYYG